MKHYADFAVYGRDGRLALLVEVKGRSGVSSDWAIQLRRNMLAHGLLPPAPFFLIVLADRFYLWRNDDQLRNERASGGALRSPDVEADVVPALAPFVESVGLDLRTLSGSSLELVVQSWLGTLIGARDSDTDHAEWLRSSGLLDAVRGGRVEVETLVAQMMTVYAESNFVLELARVQEQHASCAALVALAASGAIRLAVPAYSLAEPFETLGRSARTRSELARKVDAERRQIARSAPSRTDAEALRAITGLLTRSQDEEEERLRSVQRDLAGSAAVLPLTAQVILDAQTLIETQVFDGPQDALVYATVIADLDGTAQGESVFLNRNSKDFDVPDVRSGLEERGCLLIPTFDDGLRYVQSKLGL